MSHTTAPERLVGMNLQRNPLKRALAAILALTMGGNGLAMLAAGRWW